MHPVLRVQQQRVQPQGGLQALKECECEGVLLLCFPACHSGGQLRRVSGHDHTSRALREKRAQGRCKMT